MARLTIWFGVLLVAVGGGWFVATGMVHKTALIPLYFGLALLLSGFLASTDDAKKRMLWMHIAVTVGLVGFVMPAAMAITGLVKSHANGTPLLRPEAVHEQLTMAGICLVFTALCVRSFIAARRARIV